MKRPKIKFKILIDCDGRHRTLRRSSHCFGCLIQSLSEELSPFDFSHIYNIHQVDPIFD